MLSFSDIEHMNTDFDKDENIATVLSQKIIISLKPGKGRSKITQIEGLSNKYNLDKILKKLQVIFACGGHIAKIKELHSDKIMELIVLNGNFPSEVKSFLIQEQIADSDAIIIHGV